MDLALNDCCVLGKGHKINKTNIYLERKKLYITENKQYNIASVAIATKLP